MELNGSGSRNSSVSTKAGDVLDIAIQPGPLMAIEGVEELGAKTNPEILPESEVLEYGNILVQRTARARARQDTRIPEGVRRSRGERATVKNEGCRAEEVDIATAQARLNRSVVEPYRPDGTDSGDRLPTGDLTGSTRVVDVNAGYRPTPTRWFNKPPSRSRNRLFLPMAIHSYSWP